MRFSSPDLIAVFSTRDPKGRRLVRYVCERRSCGSFIRLKLIRLKCPNANSVQNQKNIMRVMEVKVFYQIPRNMAADLFGFEGYAFLYLKKCDMAK